MMKIAIMAAGQPGLVTLPTNDKILASSARRAGYTIARDAEHATELREAAELAKSEKSKTYLDRLLELPEATDRPLAAARIAAKHSIDTMPLPKAALFLSGLPVEIEASEQTMDKPSPALDRLIKRKTEIAVLGLQRKATQGDQKAKAQARAIGYALDLHASSRMTFLDALKASRVDLPALRKSLASISDPA